MNNCTYKRGLFARAFLFATSILSRSEYVVSFCIYKCNTVTVTTNKRTTTLSPCYVNRLGGAHAAVKHTKNQMEHSNSSAFYNC